jgi:NarL family two-component system response regulator LiaR
MPDASGGFLLYDIDGLFENDAIMHVPVRTHRTRNAILMIKPNPIGIMIVDDHDMVRKGLTIFLEAFDDLELVGEAADGKEAIRLCAELQPHVVLMDLVMPEMDGVAATQAICKAYPEVKIIALTSFGNQVLVQRALQAGAVGYLLKSASIDEMANAIRTAHTS